MECRVCERSGASKHNHYGAERICTSCRGFFLRAVQSGLYEFFQCAKDKSKPCVIDSKQRQSCRKCRFAKCLEVGMKAAYVLDKQERCRRMLPSPQGSPRSTPSPSVSPDEIQEIANIYEMLTEDTLKYGVKYYAASPGLLWQHFGLCDDGGKILSFEDVQIMYSMDDYCVPASVIDFVKRFGITHDNDLQLIARKSFVPLHIIFLGLYSFSQLCTEWWTRRIAQYTETHLGESVDVDIVANELANMKLAGFDGKCKSDNHYDNFFRSPWAPDLSQEQRHKQLMMEFCKWFYLDQEANSGHNQMEVDYNLIVLVCLVIIFNTDDIGGDLVQKKEIEAIHLKYAKIMWQYLKEKSSKTGNSKFYKGLMMAESAKEAYQLSMNRLPI